MTDFAAQTYRFRHKPISEPYVNRQLQFTVSWFKECKEIYIYVELRKFSRITNLALSQMYLYDRSETSSFLDYSEVARCSRRWYHARRATAHSNAWILTDSIKSPPFLYYHHDNEPLYLLDMEEIVFGHQRVAAAWLFEIWSETTITCLICGVSLSPTAVSLPRYTFGFGCPICTVD